MDKKIDLRQPWRGKALERGFGIPFDFAVFDDEDNLVAGFRRNGGLTDKECETLMKLVKNIPKMYDTIERARNVLKGLQTMTDEEYHGARNLVDLTYGKLVSDMDDVLEDINGVDNE